MMLEAGTGVVTKPSRSSIRPGAIDQAKQLLKQAPIKEKHDISLRQVIREMQQEIEEVMQKGYTCDEVAAMLAQSEINIQGSTLKQYLSQAKRNNSERKNSSSKTKMKKVEKSKKIESDVKLQEEITTVSENASDLSEDTEKVQTELDRNRVKNFVEMPEDL